jgi:hypothetical protein
MSSAEDLNVARLLIQASKDDLEMEMEIREKRDREREKG